jgi:hypothetical protein
MVKYVLGGALLHPFFIVTQMGLLIGGYVDFLEAL